MSTKKKMLWLLSLLPFFIACGDDNTDIPDWPWAEPETPTEPVEANPDIVNFRLDQCEKHLWNLA